MHDRRVVRGNTFAALVIPVSKDSLLLYQFRHSTRCASAELTASAKTTQSKACLRGECQQFESGKIFGR